MIILFSAATAVRPTVYCSIKIINCGNRLDSKLLFNFCLESFGPQTKKARFPNWVRVLMPRGCYVGCRPTGTKLAACTFFGVGFDDVIMGENGSVADP